MRVRRTADASTITELATNLDVIPGTRDDHKDNVYGLLGFDHFALPSMDIDRMYAFIIEVLGGVPFYVAGFDDVDRGLGRKKHIFMRVGTTLMQCATPHDGQVKIGKEDANLWPHWAFAVTPEGMEANVERLRSLGIPVYGPAGHRGAHCVSAYFASPEGHKLELTTWSAYPAEKTIGTTGAPGVGHPDWTLLYHDWPNVQGPGPTGAVEQAG
jgi:hypothetical protein